METERTWIRRPKFFRLKGGILRNFVLMYNTFFVIPFLKYIFQIFLLRV